MPLPTHYLITPAVENEAQFLSALERSLRSGTRLLQLKGKGLDEASYRALAKKVIALAHGYGCRVLLNGTPELVQQLGADGLHLDSKALTAVTTRPLPEAYLLAVSGHSLEALQRGEALGASFAVLSPIRYTSAHPDIAPIGWDGVRQITAQIAIPVYALGGVDARDETAACEAGAQGIAGNRGYWGV